MRDAKEAEFALQFVNHCELSRPDLAKDVLLKGTFHEAQMDRDMIAGCNFMLETHLGVLTTQASMTLVAIIT